MAERGAAEEARTRSLMTASPGLTGEGPLYLTGNEYLSLPEIGPGGEIGSLNLLHGGARGLLEFRGAAGRPLLAPFVRIGGEELLRPEALSWSYRGDWLPHFELHAGDRCSVEGAIFAPPGHRGCCYRLRLTNPSGRPLRAEVGWQGCWSEFNYLLFSRRPVRGERAAEYSDWTGSLLLEARSGLPLAALALALDPPPGPGMEGPRWNLHGGGGEPAFYRKAITLELPPGGSTALTLYLAVNLEADGAGTTAMDLRRRGGDALATEALLWLERRRLELTPAGAAALANRNLFFNYFYALGRTLDGDRLVPVTSRSPRYYVSAAFWSRDTLLWSFPGLLLVDRAVSREVLLAVFDRHLDRAGEHAHYIDGSLLYPGFELDQLAAHFLALQRYERASGDLTLPGEGVIARGLGRLLEKALAQHDPESGLYRTFLDPSDDPVTYPFLIYDNALLQCAFTYLGALQEAGRWEHPRDLAGMAAALQRAIYRHGTVKGPCGPMFAWAVDGAGRFQLYDNPPGSLQLLGYHGFCSPRDRVYRNTVAWIRSPDNPHFHHDRPFAEAGSRHAPGPWPLAACNDLLALSEGGLDFLLRAPLDNGFCCETVDPLTGRAATGAAFASAAGFLAHALQWSGRERTAGGGEGAGGETGSAAVEAKKGDPGSAAKERDREGSNNLPQKES